MDYMQSPEDHAKWVNIKTTFIKFELLTKVIKVIKPISRSMTYVHVQNE